MSAKPMTPTRSRAFRRATRAFHADGRDAYAYAGDTLWQCSDDQYRHENAMIAEEWVPGGLLSERAFDGAVFIRHVDGRKGVRDLNLEHHQWTIDHGDGHPHRAATTEEVAASGWLPVYEADDDASAAASAYSYGYTDGREDAAECEADALQDALRRWENADRLEGCKPGDTLIERLDPDVDAFTIYRADYSANAQALPDTIRVAGRAPEPWKDLADVIADHWPEAPVHMRSDQIARILHERGVRVTGGDEA